MVSGPSIEHVTSIRSVDEVIQELKEDFNR